MAKKTDAAAGPNWRTGEGYPDPTTTSLDRWALEFLMRNSDFRQEHEAAMKESLSLKSSNRLPLAWSQQPIGQVWREWGIAYAVLPEWRERGLFDSLAHFERFPRHTARIKVNGIDACVTEAMNTRLVLEFDLTAPLRPQVDRAARILKASQENYKGPKRTQGKNSTRLFPKYLRILDMCAAKVSRAKMLELLSADDPNAASEDDIRNWTAAAEALRDGGYRKIIQNAAP